MFFLGMFHPTIARYLLMLHDRAHHASWCEIHSGEFACDCGLDSDWDDLTYISTFAERKKAGREFLDRYSKKSQGLL